MIFLEHISQHPIQYITEFYSSEKIRIDTCPQCHSRQRLHLHGCYFRYVIWFEEVFSIPIQRHLCIHCKKTISVLPSFCHPKFQLALPFILELLTAFFNALSFTHYRPRQHLRFIVTRFITYHNRLIEFFRIFYDPLLCLPDSGHKKAIKLLEMVTHANQPHIFAKRFYDHFKKGFMAH